MTTTLKQQQQLGSAPGPGRKIQIFLVDYHPIALRGLTSLIGREQCWEVCGSAQDFEAAVTQIERVRPELLVVDLDLRGRSGLDLIKRVKPTNRAMAALVFSMHDESLYASRALRAGASGYVMKDQPLEVLLGAMREVLAGNIYVSERLLQTSRSTRFSAHGRTVVDRLGLLTDRELDVFRLIGQGKSSQEVAGLLILSVKTVGAHRVNMMAKLGLTSANQLVQHAIELHSEHFRNDSDQGIARSSGINPSDAERGTGLPKAGVLVSPLPWSRLQPQSVPLSA